MSPRSSSTDIAQPVDVEKDMHGLPSVNQGQPKPRPFTHSWSDPEIAAARGLYVKAMTFSTATTIIMLLAILSMYWGAFWQVPSHLHKLDITVVDLDGGSIGQAVVALFASPQVTGGKNQLSYTMASSRDFSSVDDVREYVLSEHTWGAVVVAPGASANLQQALTTGDATYNSSTVLTVLIVGARNENAVARLIQPPVTGALNHFVELYADSHSRGIPDNIDVRAVLKTAPQLINRPVSYHTEDIRPFDVPVASAVDFVGLIYLLVLVFLTAMLNYNIRLMTGLNELLSLQALIAVRFIVPFACYFFLSWFYSFISLAFQVPFSRAVGSGGFVLYWLSSFLGMSALGAA
ncbi:hypothetical protein BKA62DRAFT_268536 [Auriculariales sp. MPI-PUGE-AT-0066]|nr:hypothetical protein BKA62DRAFT_268536 [Auriculariales sp. MPI-PUGE-AT-0066]